MKKHPEFMLLTVVIISCTFCALEPSPEPADLVLLNGKMITMNPDQPLAEAIAIRGETLLAVGTLAEIEPYIGGDTRSIDLMGNLALPGLIEGHGHYMSLGQSLMELDLKQARRWDEIVAMVAAAVHDAEPGEWIVGRGWHQDKWTGPPEPNVEGTPLHQGLSKISAQNPVMLVHVSGHGIFVNALALEQVGIGKATPDPAGGEIIRDRRGNPTGMLRETAQDSVREAVARYRSRRTPEVIEAELREQVRLAAQEALEQTSGGGN